MDTGWTYYKLLGGRYFDRILGVYRRKLGGYAERWDADAYQWIPVSTSFLNDRLADGAIDLDLITGTEALDLVEKAASRHPAQPSMAD